MIEKTSSSGCSFVFGHARCAWLLDSRPFIASPGGIFSVAWGKRAGIGREEKMHCSFNVNQCILYIPESNYQAAPFWKSLAVETILVTVRFARISIWTVSPYISDYISLSHQSGQLWSPRDVIDFIENSFHETWFDNLHQHHPGWNNRQRTFCHSADYTCLFHKGSRFGQHSGSNSSTRLYHLPIGWSQEGISMDFMMKELFSMHLQLILPWL